MSAIVYDCAREVHWIAEGLTVRCVRPARHAGLHNDGLWWFDKDGLRVPRLEADMGAGPVAPQLGRPAGRTAA